MSESTVIADGIFWVGDDSATAFMRCNPYLIVENDEGILIDPGSVLDFDVVFEKVTSIISLEKIKYVILHHQDPDFCSSVPLFEKKGANFTIITHWRTKPLLDCYGITSPYYIINVHAYELTLKSGRTLSFLVTPYLHFAGAFITYDSMTGTLFTSDLFGAASHKWSLYAGDDYMEKMKSFHEHYMPSNQILRPVMEILLQMKVELIAPQHGSIIHKDIEEYIKALRDLECGLFLKPVKKKLTESKGYLYLCRLVIKRLATLYGMEEILPMLNNLSITTDKDFDIQNYSKDPQELWEELFQEILMQKGLDWIVMLETYVTKLTSEYDISLPKIFDTLLSSSKMQLISVSSENEQLKQKKEELEERLKEYNDRFSKCPVTGLYNYDFFINYINSEISLILDKRIELNPGLLIIRIDNIDRIEYYYGVDEVENLYRNITYLLKDILKETEQIFKLPNAYFGLYIPDVEDDILQKTGQKIQTNIENSDKFIEKITITYGISTLEDFRFRNVYGKKTGEAIYNMAVIRTKMAKNIHEKKSVQNTVLPDDVLFDVKGVVLLVGTDLVMTQVLKTAIENMNVQVVVAQNGEIAAEKAESIKPFLIISEVMMPKKDGFLLREQLLQNPRTKDIPFIYLSYLKNDSTVLRASQLGVEHYFKKPIMVTELLGIIQNKIKELPK